MDNKKLHVLGSHKTGTSTMVGLLNCHPDIFCYFEYRVDGKLKKKHVVWPKLKRKYLWVGDKNPVLGTFEQTNNRIELYEDSSIIFCYRDIQNWLSHDSIMKIYKSDKDVITPTTKYIYYFLMSHYFPNVIHVKLETLLGKPNETVEEIADFLDVEPTNFYEWWNKVGKWKDKNKLHYKWWKGHSCAVKKPTVDVCVELKKHEFWNEVLPIMENPVDYLHYDVKELEKFGKLPLGDIIEIRKFTKISTK